MYRRNLSTEAYRGTTCEYDFMIYHDAMKQYWKMGARENIAARGCAYRIRILRSQAPSIRKCRQALIK